MASDRAVPLGLLRPGEGGKLTEIRGLRHTQHGEARSTGAGWSPRHRRDRHLMTTDRGHRLEHRLNYLGLVPGVTVRVIQNSASGPIVLSVKGSRLCLGRGIAMRLMVEPDGGSAGEYSG